MEFEGGGTPPGGTSTGSQQLNGEEGREQEIEADHRPDQLGEETVEAHAHKQPAETGDV